MLALRTFFWWEHMLQPAGIAGGEAFGDFSTDNDRQLSVSGIPSAEVFGTILMIQGFLILPDGVESDAVIGSPLVSIVNGPQFVLPVALVSDEQWGTPGLHREVNVPGIGTAEVVGILSVGGQIEPAGIESEEAVPGGAISRTILPVSVMSHEAFGTLFTTRAMSYAPFVQFPAKKRMLVLKRL